jgi:flagellar hook-associated protein FlgK
MISAASIALSGMTAAQTGLAAAGHNIANLETAGFRRQQVVLDERATGGVGVALGRAPLAGNALETDMVALLQARHAFVANLAVFRSGERMVGSLLDAVA